MITDAQTALQKDATMYQDSAIPTIFQNDFSSIHSSSAMNLNTLQKRVDARENFDIVLYELARRLHRHLDIDTVLADVVHSSCTIFEAQAACAVVLCSQGLPARWQASHAHLQPSDPRVIAALNAGPEMRAIQEKQPLVVDGTRSGADEAPALLSGRSLVVVPMYTADDMVGVLTLSYEKPQVLDARLTTLLSDTGEIMAQALRNAYLHTRLNINATSHENGRFRLVHDIRSPLMAVSASLDIIKRALSLQPLDDELQHLVAEAITSGKNSLTNVLALADDILDVRKLRIGRETLEYESVALELLYSDVFDTLHHLAVQRHVMLRYTVHPRVLHIPGDRHFLQRMMTNLVSNALRFTASGSTVSMHAYPAPGDEYVILAVEDMGPGVPPEDRKRIFQPFEQGKGESNRGTGLGLAICQEVAHAHGGRIWVEDNEPRGSRFCVMLPSQELAEAD